MNEIVEHLKTECPFEEVFKEVEENSPPYAPRYRKKIGHLRADHDGWRWWNTWWPCHQEMLTRERAAEIDAVYDALIAKNCFSGLNALRGFCDANAAESAHPGDGEGEHDFYYEGEHCNYWLRLITRKGDYNMYLHVFVRESK